MGSDPTTIANLATIVVSIHAPAWGATTFPELISETIQFQFTLPHGERQIERNLLSQRVSFNSRSRMGSDAFPLRQVPLLPQFQFTLPHGERLQLALLLNGSPTFQFTLPHGERLAGNKARGCGGLFPVLRRV